MKTRVRNPILRLLLIAVGWISVCLGGIGIFVPLLPTVPFLLLAAVCFARSSEMFHRWLVSHPRLGPMINGFLSGEGIPLHAKLTAIAILWCSILLSVMALAILLWVKLLLILVGICVSWYLISLPVKHETCKDQ